MIAFGTVILANISNDHINPYYAGSMRSTNIGQKMLKNFCALRSHMENKDPTIEFKTKGRLSFYFHLLEIVRSTDGVSQIIQNISEVQKNKLWLQNTCVSTCVFSLYRKLSSTHLNSTFKLSFLLTPTSSNSLWLCFNYNVTKYTNGPIYSQKTWS